MEEDSSTHPLVIQMINEVADFISAAEFCEFYEMHKTATTWIPHTIISYLFNIFSIFVKVAKNPHTIRRYKIENMIKYDDVNLSSLMISSLIDQLRLCTATGSLQVLFANPPSSFKHFCPHLLKKELPTQNTKRPPEGDKLPDGKKDRKDSKGSILNTTGKRLTFPPGLEGKYYSNFLDSGTICTRDETYKFTHSVFPHEFVGQDVNIFREHIEKPPGLSFTTKQSADKKVSA